MYETIFVPCGRSADHRVRISACGTAYTSERFFSHNGLNVTMGFGINDAGTVVGTDGSNQGFVRSPNGIFTTLNFPGAAQTQVTGIADNNTKVGIFVDQAGASHGLIGTPSGSSTVFTELDQSGSAFNQLLGISADGTKFAGYSSTDPAGQVLQKAYVDSVQNHTFSDVNPLLTFNFNSQATGVNNAGTVVGFFQPSPATSLGFEDLNGTIHIIDPDGSTNTQALGISSTGEIVGFYSDANNIQHGYTDINGTIATFDPPGSMNTTINGVNGQGQLIGFYTNAADQVSGFVATPIGVQTPVSEPASTAILGIGALALIGIARRRADA